MGLQREKATASPTVTLPVLVQFQTDDNTVVQGDFMGKFKRVDQDRLDELMDPEANYRNSDVLDEVLVGVSGIGENGSELPADEQLAWVKKTPECVSAAVAAFFKALRPARYDEKTSKSRRSRG